MKNKRESKAQQDPSSSNAITENKEAIIFKKVALFGREIDSATFLKTFLKIDLAFFGWSVLNGLSYAQANAQSFLLNCPLWYWAIAAISLYLIMKTKETYSKGALTVIQNTIYMRFVLFAFGVFPAFWRLAFMFKYMKDPDGARQEVLAELRAANQTDVSFEPIQQPEWQTLVTSMYFVYNAINLYFTLKMNSAVDNLARLGEDEAPQDNRKAISDKKKKSQ
jgi:hypothetical protein